MSLTRLRTYISSHSCRGPQYVKVLASLQLSPRMSQSFQCSTTFSPWRNPPNSLEKRYYATTSLNREPGTSRTPVTLVTRPNSEEQDGEIELVDWDMTQLLMTERAAEKLFSISTEDDGPIRALRVAVESGGCHGYQYTMELTSKFGADDYLFTHPKYHTPALVVDAVSLGLLNGSTVDYATELIGSSFRILDNPQAKGNGCGCGVSWEAKF